MFTDLAKDEQDSVRLLVVEACARVALATPAAERESAILPAVLECAQDKSWRVRYVVAGSFGDISQAFGERITQECLAQHVVALVGDSEAEVRAVACSKLAESCRHLNCEQLVAHMIPAVQAAAADECEHVRSSLASSVMSLSMQLGKDNTQQYLLPLFMDLLKDTSSDVRLHLLSRLGDLNQVIGTAILSQSLVPTITALGQDEKWRVRIAVVEHVPKMAEQLGVEFFDGEVRSLCESWLTDSVFAVRCAATENVRFMTEKFGVAWAGQHLIPNTIALTESVNYLHRSVSLMTIGHLGSVVPQDYLAQELLPKLALLADDNVPNIRFGVAKTLAKLSSSVTPQVLTEQVQPLLTKLQQDTDADVQFYAYTAMQDQKDTMEL
jgi:serine/threonine-protein phosphatase 2A regulatory subunit A